MCGRILFLAPPHLCPFRPFSSSTHLSLSRCFLALIVLSVTMFCYSIVFMSKPLSMCLVPYQSSHHSSPSEPLYCKTVFPVPATHNHSTHDIYSTLRLAVRSFFQLPIPFGFKHWVLASMLVHFIPSAIHTHIVRSFPARCHSRYVIMT